VRDVRTLTGRARMAAFWVVLVAFAMDLIDMTIVNVALPSIKADLGAGAASLQWMVAGYSMTFAMLLILGGRLGDIYGYGRIFAIGVAAFTLASLLCGLAPSAGALVAARLAQGAAAALMLPQVLALAQIMFAPHERIAALSLFGVLGGVCGVMGPVLGGLIIGADLFGLGWRPIFLINIPVGIACVVAALRLLPSAPASGAVKLDVGGALVLAAALACLLYPMIQGRELGWPAWLLAPAAAGLVLLGVFHRRCGLRMRKNGSALAPPELFTHLGFNVGLLLTLAFQIASVGLLFVLSLTLQQGLGMTAAHAGLIHAPYALGAMLAIGYVSRRIFPKLGVRMLSLGAGVMAAGLVWLAFAMGIPGAHGLVAIGAGMFLAGFGMGLVAGPLPPVTLASIDLANAGAGSGVLKSVQQFGAAAGAALLGAIFFANGGDRGSGMVDAYRLATLVAVGCLAAVAGGGLLMPRGLLAPPKVADGLDDHRTNV
jgi:EmrB/QacA subfamily drug resistance transporter